MTLLLLSQVCALLQAQAVVSIQRLGLNTALPAAWPPVQPQRLQTVASTAGNSSLRWQGLPASLGTAGPTKSLACNQFIN